jgi:hypothetical protein
VFFLANNGGSFCHLFEVLSVVSPASQQPPKVLEDTVKPLNTYTTATGGDFVAQCFLHKETVDVTKVSAAAQRVFVYAVAGGGDENTEADPRQDRADQLEDPAQGPPETCSKSFDIFFLAQRDEFYQDDIFPVVRANEVCPLA